MPKHSIRRLAIFFTIVALFPLCYLAYILFLQSAIYYSFHGVGDGIAIITTWLDTNSNGIRDDGEPPFPNVCVGYVGSLNDLIRQTGFPCEPEDKTNSQGVGGSEFLPGWTGIIYKYATPPEGYQPTTDMVSTDYDAKFGFVQEGTRVPQTVGTVDEFIRQELIKRWARYTSVVFFILVIALYATINIEKQIFNTESAN